MGAGHEVDHAPAAAPSRHTVAHGALDHAELARLGLAPADLLDFSSNLNPFGPPPGVREALARLDVGPYPDRSCLALRRALAARHRLAPEQILPGNGANELIHLLARTLLAPGDTALVVGPTYGEYAHACRLSGAQVREWRAGEAEGFALDTGALAQAIESSRPRLTWLCAPNNPTGADLAPGQVRALAALCADHGGLLVADRAYAAFTRGEPPAADRDDAAVPQNTLAQAPDDRLDQSPPPNLLRLHSLTKSYALAGLRLGYLLGAPELMPHGSEQGTIERVAAHQPARSAIERVAAYQPARSAIERVAAYQPAWSVSSAAQAAGLAALADEEFLPATMPRLWAASDQLLDGLRALGLSARRGALPFLLVRVGDAAAARAALLARGCVVRDCASFGLPAWVRVAPRRPEENARLLQAWGEIL